MTKSLKGKVAFVTGATGGIGSAIARRLAIEGADTVIGYNSDGAGAERHCRSFPAGRHIAVQARVTESQALHALADRIEETFGRLDLLVNCAGTTRFVPHEDLDSLDDELIDRIFAVNVRGVIATVRAMHGLLRLGEPGLVVNISSIAAATAMGSNIAYCASKAAVDNLTKSLARALAPSIRVVSIAPGLVDTEFVKGLDREWRDLQAGRTPMGRLGSPEDVAEAVVAATHLGFTTGAIIPVDGGRPLA